MAMASISPHSNTLLQRISNFDVDNDCSPNTSITPSNAQSKISTVKNKIKKRSVFAHWALTISILVFLVTSFWVQSNSNAVPSTQTPYRKQVGTIIKILIKLANINASPIWAMSSEDLVDKQLDYIIEHLTTDEEIPPSQNNINNQTKFTNDTSVSLNQSE